MNCYSIQKLPPHERPRERLTKYGPETLSTIEMIAILLGSGTKSAPVLHLAQTLLTHFGSLKEMAQATIPELCQIPGLGPAKAAQLKAAFTLSQRIAQQSPDTTKYQISNPIHAYNLVRDTLEHEKRELFIVVMLDTKGHHINSHITAVGTLSKLLIHPREVFYPAIRHKAARIILAHNHPSGDPTPSEEDYKTTKALQDASSIIGIPITDHIIVGNKTYSSLRELGFNFP